MLHGSDFRQVRYGAFRKTSDITLTTFTENPCGLLYILKPVIVTTDSKELTTILLYLLSIKTGKTFNFQFLNFQKVICFFQ